VVAVARLAAIRAQRTDLSGDAPLDRAAARTLQSIRMQMSFEPLKTCVLVKQFVNGKVNHTWSLAYTRT